MTKLYSMMGLCLRAGKLLVGRDAVIAAVKRGRVRSVYLTSDAAASHRRELAAVAPDLPVLALPFTMDDALEHLGKRSCIFAAADGNFAAAIEKLI